MYQIIQKRKIWLSASSLLVVASLACLMIWGLRLGIDFTGGSLLELKFDGNRPSVSEVNEYLSDLKVGNLIIQPVGEDAMILRFQNTEESVHQSIIKKLSDLSQGEKIEGDINKDDVASSSPVSEQSEKVVSGISELRYDAVGPSIGEELKRKSITAMLVVLIAIVLYIAWAFRLVSKPVASWKYGLSAIAALFHDVIITLGVFAILGKFMEIEVNTPFVAAILTVLGYSVNDTIVVFDRVRENLPKSDEDFEGTVNTSVNQTIQRSINTSVTTLLVLLSILFFGGSSIHDFILALSIGVFVGTYSSIFLASPILILWENWKK